MDSKNIFGILDSGAAPTPDPVVNINPPASGVKPVWQKSADMQRFWPKNGLFKDKTSPYTPLIIGGIGFLVVMILRRMITNRS